MKDDFLWMVAYWQAVARLTKANIFALFARAILYFAGRNEDED